MTEVKAIQSSNHQIKALRPRIAVIGAGPAGISIAKNLLQEGLTHFTVFEKNSALGGNWLFSSENTHSSVYETTHIISSKRLSEYEDFPMPQHYSDYPSHTELLSYFNDYAAHFGLNDYIQFNTEVKTATLDERKKWQLTFLTQDGLKCQEFDYLFVANGHHWDPLIPAYPGNFTGQILHSHDYKRAEPFKNKRVLVVGGGNSACDVAVEISRIGAKTCISMRRGQHIFPKFLFGKPTDLAFAKLNWLPMLCKQFIAQVIIRLIQGRYAKYQLQSPIDKPLAIHPTINSELLYFIRHGKIHPRPGLKNFSGSKVHFIDGREDDFDCIIYATGYQISFPFFSQDFIDYSREIQIPLYQKMLHPEHENLYFIGLFQPQGCIWPLADYQAKIAAKMIKGSLKRPSNLKKKIEKEIFKASKVYHNNLRHALEVDYQRFRSALLKELDRS